MEVEVATVAKGCVELLNMLGRTQEVNYYTLHNTHKMNMHTLYKAKYNSFSDTIFSEAHSKRYR